MKWSICSGRNSDNQDYGGPARPPPGAVPDGARGDAKTDAPVAAATTALVAKADSIAPAMAAMMVTILLPLLERCAFLHSGSRPAPLHHRLRCLAWAGFLPGEQKRPVSFLTCTLTRNCLLSSWSSQTRRSSGSALRTERDRRATSELASHIYGPWHVVCVHEGAGFDIVRSLKENFHVITWHHCAVFLNKDTFEREHTCTPIQVPCTLKYSSCAVEGMVVTGKFRKAPDPSCSYLTVANIHINNECAKRRSVHDAWRCHPHRRLQ